MGLAAGTRLGRYEIGALVGAGGMGEVYRARDPTLRRDVAVKVLPERLGNDGERQRRFEREARAAAELEHPSIIAVYDVGVDGGVPFIVTELLDGKTLADALRHGRLPRARAIEIAIQIARGVAAAHDKGIVHRDLKPSNVFVCRDGRVKILDFGLATHVAEGTPAGDDTTFTETGAILGTPAYMSPEQVRGQRVDPRADLFALGAILYEMLSGRRPFAGEGTVALGHAILTQDPEPLGDPALDAIVRRCLAKDPAARSRCAADLAFELEAFGSNQLPAPPARSRRPWGLAVTAGLAAALAVALVARPTGPVAPPSAPSYTQITFRDEFHGRARFAPDGQTVIYDVRMWDPASFQVFSSVPGRSEARPLTEPGTTLLAVSATGDMLLKIYSQDKVVIAQAAVAGGAPRILYDDVTRAGFSPDGSALAIVRSVGAKERLEYPVGHVLFTTSFRIGLPRVSPRGDRVTFALYDNLTHEGYGNATGTIEVVARDGTRRTLGGRWRNVDDPMWSPDGREVWVSGRRGAFRSIYGLDLDGHERTVLELPAWLTLEDVARDGRVLVQSMTVRFGIAASLPGTSGEIDLSWRDQSLLVDLSSDGRMILFTECGESTQEKCEAYVRRTDGSLAVALGAGTPYALSPDGAWALVGAAEGPERSLELVPTGAGERRTLPAGPIGRYEGAHFFADGRRIALYAREGGHDLRVWIQDVEQGDPRPITEEGVTWMGRPSSNSEVVPACRAGSCALYPVAGGEPRLLPPAKPGSSRPLQLTTDGRSLIVGRPWRPLRASSPEHASLWVVDIETGAERLLRELDLRHFVFLPYSFRLTPDGGGHAYSYARSTSDIILVKGVR